MFFVVGKKGRSWGRNFFVVKIMVGLGFRVVVGRVMVVWVRGFILFLSFCYLDVVLVFLIFWIFVLYVFLFVVNLNVFLGKYFI